MCRKYYFAHVSPAGISARTLLNRKRVKWVWYGENIGWTMNMGLWEGSRWMVRWWKQSPVHNRTMLRARYTHAGIGVVKCGATNYYTMVLIDRA
jgi:uncharacterized protein YkwD